MSDNETPQVEQDGTEEPTPRDVESSGEFDPQRAHRTIKKVREEKREIQRENRALKGQLEDLTRRFSSIESTLGAKLTEMESKLAQAEETRKKAELDAAKTSAAAAFGLPPELAKRLTGDTPEAIQQDAEELAKAMPVPQKPGGRQSPGNSGQGVNGQSFTEALLEQMRGKKAGPSEASQPSVHKAKGGGVVGID